jgi:hypothetical protein
VKVLVLMGVTLFVAFLYTFLHESGHALVGVLAGGSVSAFSINFFDLSAHVGLNGSLTPAQAIVNNLAGVGLPLLVWLVFIAMVPKRANFALECLKVAGSLVFLSTLLAWVGLPLLVWAGQAPSDDVVNFLNNSGVHPLVVTVAALGLWVGGWWVFGSRIDGLGHEVDLFRKVEGSGLTLQEGKTLLSIGGIGLMCGLVAFGANGFRLTVPTTDPFQPPQGYQLVGKVSLADGAHDRTDVYSFTLTTPTKVGIYLLVEDAKSDYLEVKLTGPAAYERLILHAEGYTARRDNPHIEEVLQPGRYTVILTNQPSSGTVSVFSTGVP